MTKKNLLLFIFLWISIGLSLKVALGGSFMEDKKNIEDRKVVATNAVLNKKENVTENPKLITTGFITPHHLVAEKLIEEIFAKAAELNKGKKIERIVLISPNHFNHGHASAISRKESWPNFSIEIDQEAVDGLEKEKFIFSENAAFDGEHGIEGLLPFVEKHFPTQKVLPIVLKEDFSVSDANKLASFLNNLEGETLLILSADFSHYLDDGFAQFHDQKAIELIENFDFSQVDNLDIDCVGGLRTIMQFANSGGYNNFTLTANSNSSKIGGKNFIGETTSYITGYFSLQKKEKKERSAHLLFTGDVMLDRDVRRLISQKSASWPTKRIERLFWSQDINMVNLEGPITSNESISLGTEVQQREHFLFTFDPEQTTNFLELNRINLVNLNNNHTLNFGPNGLNQTKNILKKKKVDFLSKEQDYISKETNGIKIGFVGYSWFSGNSFEKVLESVKKAKKENDYVVVYTHWGREYELVQNQRQVTEAHQMVDHGADLIIGSHPHVVQPVEAYKGKTIFYSLGNFVFDQYFSEETRTMLAVGARVNKDKTELYLAPLYQEKDGRIIFANQEKREELLQRIIGNIDDPSIRY